MTDELDAQRLVTQGYSPKHYARKVYLIQLVDDQIELQNVKDPASKDALAQKRRERWQQQGILPVAVFRSLLAAWIKDKLLSRQTVAQSDKKTAPSPPLAIDLGITYAGFEKLQVHSQLLDLFQRHTPAYSKGAYKRAKEYLGDTGASDPEHWATPYHDQNVHVLLFAHSKTVAPDTFHELEYAVHCKLGENLDGVSAMPPAPSLGRPLKGDWTDQSVRLSADGKTIHFDMVDNITAPKFEGLDDVTEVKPFNRHKLGELLLGHPRNDDTNVWRLPHALPQPIGNNAPKFAPERVAYGKFFENGTFGAFRKMRQNVDAFNKCIDVEAGISTCSWPKDYTIAWLKAKMLGRWPNGERVTEAHGYPGSITVSPTDLLRKGTTYFPGADDNEFGFEDDQKGLGCPMGAHIRRTHPRNDAIGPFITRPLLRRGTPYGGKDAGDKGLLGLFFCSSLEEQFEHVVGAWVNSSPLRLSAQGFVGKDPLIGIQDAYNAEFEIPTTATQKITLEGIPSFVQTVGTSYAFFPSIFALEKIANDRLGSYKRFVT